MPGLAPSLTLDTARDRIRERCFPARDEGLVGLESEWHVFDRADVHRVVPLDALAELVGGLGPLPGGSVVTFEPGGQLELSSPPLAPFDAACDALAADHDAVAAALATRRWMLLAVGVDPVRPPQRQLRLPRYDAMEAFFDRDGPAGRRMMCRTAALQINVDNGGAEWCQHRWQLAHRIGPALAAAFATSPLAEGRPTGRASTRLSTWLDIDPTRTAAVRGGCDEWISYALDANVLLVRHGDAMVPMRERLPFWRWILDGHAMGSPTEADLDYHLTTLFPPVRPRGFLEIRYLDAVPHPWWRVAAAVVTALLSDPAAGDEAWEVCGPVADRWCESAYCGLADPALAHAAAASIAAARAAFDRLGFAATTAATCDRYIEQYVSRCRSPGDDLLDAWRRGEPVVAVDSEEERWT